MSILNQSLENLKLLSDQQLGQVLQDARSGNGQVLQALGMQSAVPLLAEKSRRDNIRQAQAGQQAMQQGQQPTIADQIMGQGQAPVSGIGAHEIPGMMEEQNYAGGGIVAFAPGGLTTRPSPQVNDFASQIAALGPERTRREQAVEDAFKEEMGIVGLAPTPSNKEEIRRRAFEESAAVDAPFLEEMRALNEANKPSEKSARDKAFLALMTGRGQGLSGAIGDMAAAGGIGLDAYTAAQNKHQEAQRLMLKSKLELAKGNKKYADELADAAVREDRNANSLYKTGMQSAYQNRRSGKSAVDQAMDARLAELKAAENARIQQLQADIRDRQVMAAIRNSGGSGSGEALRAATTRFSQIQRDLSAVDKYVNGKDFDSYAYSKDPTYVKVKTEQGPGAADAWARKQEREARRAEVFKDNGISPQDFIELGRLISNKAGIATLPAAPSAPAPTPTAGPQKGDYVYNPKTGKSEQIK